MTNKDIILAVQKIIAGAPSKALKQYLGTALWSEVDDDGNSLDDNYSIRDFSKEAMNKAKKDLNSFWQKAGKLIKKIDPTQVAHDFWLTRNGHGTGFWDRPEIYGDNKNELTEISEKMKESDAYVGDDKKIHLT